MTVEAPMTDLDTAPRTGSEGPDLLARAQSSLLHDGDLRASRALFTRALAQAEHRQRPADLAAAALGLSGLWVHERRGLAEGADTSAQQRRALSLVPPKSPWALRLAARLHAEESYLSGSPQALLDTLAQARKLGHPEALAEILALSLHCTLGPEQHALRTELAQELLRSHSATGRKIDLLLGLTWHCINQRLAADPQAERAERELQSALAEHPHRAIAFVLAAMNVMKVIRSGDLHRAEEVADQALAQGEDLGDPDALGWYHAQLTTILWFGGRSAQALPQLSEMLHSPKVSALDRAFCAALAAAAARAGDRPQAAAALAQLRGPGLGALPSSSTWLLTLRGAAEAAFFLQDQQVAAEIYDLARPYARRPAMASLAITCFGSTEHTLGLAAATLGRTNAATDHLRAAIRANTALAHWPAAVHSQAFLGQLLRTHRSPSAKTHLDQAQQTADHFCLPLPSWEFPAARVPTRPPVAPLAQLRHEGTHWQISLGARAISVRESLGLSYLSLLTHNPGHEIPCLELLAGAEVLSSQRPNLSQELLDPSARRAYRSRISQLQARPLDDAEHKELDWLLHELNASTGRSGQDRKFSRETERARISVGRALRRAVQHIKAAEPIIGQHFVDRLYTGNYCCYRRQ